MDQLPPYPPEAMNSGNDITEIPAESITPPLPKWSREEAPANNLLRSIVSLAFYAIIGYYFFPSYKILILITAIVLIHELGHFLAMKAFGYKDLGIFFIPLLGAYVSGKKREVSQWQSAIILLAGPLPGIIAGTIFFVLWTQDPFLSIAGIPYNKLALAFLFLNLINLIPVYPLDGGQLLNRVFLDEESLVSRIFILLSVGAMVWIALFAFPTPSYILLLFPAMMVLRMFGDKKINQIEKKIEAAGIHTDLDYADLPDEDYWKIRNILVEHHPSFRDLDPAPPYAYSNREDKVAATIESLLHRNLIQDTPLAGKLLIALIWIAAFLVPWWLGIYEIFLSSIRYS